MMMMRLFTRAFTGNYADKRALTACLTRKKIPEVDGIAVRIGLRLFRLVAVEVLAFTTPPHVLLVLAGHHQVFARAPASHEAVSIVVAPDVCVRGCRRVHLCVSFFTRCCCANYINSASKEAGL